MCTGLKHAGSHSVIQITKTKAIKVKKKTVLQAKKKHVCLHQFEINSASMVTTPNVQSHACFHAPSVDLVHRFLKCISANNRSPNSYFSSYGHWYNMSTYLWDRICSWKLFYDGSLWAVQVRAICHFADTFTRPIWSCNKCGFILWLLLISQRQKFTPFQVNKPRSRNLLSPISIDLLLHISLRHSILGKKKKKTITWCQILWLSLRKYWIVELWCSEKTLKTHSCSNKCLQSELPGTGQGSQSLRVVQSI